MLKPGAVWPILLLWLTVVIVIAKVQKVREPTQAECSAVGTIGRLDCYPDAGASKDGCRARGCCWVPDKSVDSGIPMCFFPPSYPSYEVESIQTTARGYDIALNRSRPSYFPEEFTKVRFEIRCETRTRLRMRLTIPSDPNRWEPPIPLGEPDKEPPKFTDYAVDIEKSPFGIKIMRNNKEKEPLIESTGSLSASTIISDQFLQMAFKLHAQRAYLPGEMRTTFPYPLNEWMRVGLWARDVAPISKANLYGVHNVLMGLTSEGSAFGLFLLNSNGQEVALSPLPAITYRVIGGILDFFVLTGPKPSDVIAQYYDLIGHPPVPPYWSLGFHLCRYGYKDLAEVKQTVQRNREAGIPVEVQWIDIDYMDSYKIFTVGKNFAELGQYVTEKLHKEMGMKSMIILDPAISTQGGPSYEPYTAGLQLGVFINDSNTKQPIRGTVWPGETVFPDFSHPNAERWWFDMASKFHETVPFDGLWIDMNEPSNFNHGSVKGCPAHNKLDNPPFVPMILDRLLYAKTVCPSAEHYNHTPHYNRHNLYGYDHARVTQSVLHRLMPTKRPFVLSRSTFAGSGRYTIHWTGDNLASWEDMRYSIGQIINFNMYGIPMVGADICGFRGDTTEELCVRWSQLGAFYPFARNHNDLASIAQDPAVWSPKAIVAIKEALNMRYMFLPYLYTLFFRAHLNGTTVARAVSFEFPEELATHTIRTQFMLGSCLLINPVVEEGRSNVEAYVPTGEWINLSAGTRIVSHGYMRNFQAPLSVIPVLVRGGCVLPLQTTPEITTVARKKGLSLFVALSTVDDGTVEAGEASTASGELFWDDGESRPLNYVHVQFEVRNRVLTIRSTPSNKDTLYRIDPAETQLRTILLVGVSKSPQSIMLNEQSVKFNYTEELQTVSITCPTGTFITRDVMVTWRFGGFW